MSLTSGFSGLVSASVVMIVILGDRAPYRSRDITEGGRVSQ
jgi:hypothetical protein